MMDPNVIASKACKLFKDLPKKGKPTEKEWTTMAAIVKETVDSSDFKVVALGTGTKCLGSKELSKLGDVVSDSHAEVIARRSFLLYLYEQIELLQKGRGDKSILEYISSDSNDTGDQKVLLSNLRVREGIRFHMFISHLPCGDAAIIDSSSGIDSSSADNSEGPTSPKRRKTENDEGPPPSLEHRTGAKLQVGPLQYEETQITGKCRVKPGKGDPTLCMSCSDKLAKWQVLGLQGSLLSNFIRNPIRLRSLVIGGGVPYSMESVQRAVFHRFSGPISEALQGLQGERAFSLESYQCPEVFQNEQNFIPLSESMVPAPASISWFMSSALIDPLGRESVQVLVSGRKQGATKKAFGKPASRVDICRTNIFERFKNFYLPANTNEQLKNSLTYEHAKNISGEYVTTWNTIKSKVFLGWTDKPTDLKSFS